MKKIKMLGFALITLTFFILSIDSNAHPRRQMRHKHGCHQRIDRRMTPPIPRFFRGAHHRPHPRALQGRHHRKHHQKRNFHY